MLGAPVNPPGDIQRVSRLGQDVVLFHWTALASFPGPRTTEGGSDGDGDGPRVRDGDRLGRGRGERGVRGEDLLLLLRGVPPAVCGRAGAVRGLSGAGRSSWFALPAQADVGEEAALVSCQQLRYIPVGWLGPVEADACTASR